MSSDTLGIWKVFTKDSPFNLVGRIVLSPIILFLCIIFTFLSVFMKDDL